MVLQPIHCLIVVNHFARYVLHSGRLFQGIHLVLEQHDLFELRAKVAVEPERKNVGRMKTAFFQPVVDKHVDAAVENHNATNVRSDRCAHCWR